MSKYIATILTALSIISAIAAAVLAGLGITSSSKTVLLSAGCAGFVTGFITGVSIAIVHRKKKRKDSSTSTSTLVGVGR